MKEVTTTCPSCNGTITAKKLLRLIEEFGHYKPGKMYPLRVENVEYGTFCLYCGQPVCKG